MGFFLKKHRKELPLIFSANEKINHCKLHWGILRSDNLFLTLYSTLKNSYAYVCERMIIWMSSNHADLLAEADVFDSHLKVFLSCHRKYININCAGPRACLYHACTMKVGSVAGLTQFNVGKVRIAISGFSANFFTYSQNVTKRKNWFFWICATAGLGFQALIFTFACLFWHNYWSLIRLRVLWNYFLKAEIYRLSRILQGLGVW